MYRLVVGVEVATSTPYNGACHKALVRHRGTRALLVYVLSRVIRLVVSSVGSNVESWVEPWSQKLPFESASSASLEQQTGNDNQVQSRHQRQQSPNTTCEPVR